MFSLKNVHYWGWEKHIYLLFFSNTAQNTGALSLHVNIYTDANKPAQRTNQRETQSEVWKEHLLWSQSGERKFGRHSSTDNDLGLGWEVSRLDMFSQSCDGCQLGKWGVAGLCRIVESSWWLQARLLAQRVETRRQILNSCWYPRKEPIPLPRQSRAQGNESPWQISVKHHSLCAYYLDPSLCAWL